MPMMRKLLNKRAMDEIDEFRGRLKAGHEVVVFYDKRSHYAVLELKEGKYEAVVRDKDMKGLKVKYYEKYGGL